jgi:hypothetical protein
MDTGEYFHGALTAHSLLALTSRVVELYLQPPMPLHVTVVNEKKET